MQASYLLTRYHMKPTFRLQVKHHLASKWER